MRIAWVVPWVHGIRGNKIVFSIASELSRLGQDVLILSHTVQSDLLAEIEQMIGGASLFCVTQTNKTYSGPLSDLSWQLSAGRDRSLARMIREIHDESPLDFVILVANEGHRLAWYLRHELRGPRPMVGCSIMELIDHTFLLRRERPFTMTRTLLSPLYPLIHLYSERCFLQYDFLCANSWWTADQVEYLYGLNCDYKLVSMPDAAFQVIEPDMVPSSSAYIAVPTVSLGEPERGVLARIRGEGLNLLSYGPTEVSGITHLGYLSESNMRRVLRGAAATLFLFDYEALGLVPFESLAVGTPVITVPKQGVYREWRDSPFVDFADNVSDFVSHCRSRLRRLPTLEERSVAQSSVSKYRASSAAPDFLRYLVTKMELRASRSDIH